MTNKQRLDEIEKKITISLPMADSSPWVYTSDVSFLIERVKTLTAALEFYAEEGVWNWHYCKKEFVKGNKCYAVSDEINQDGGDLARKTLTKGES